MKISEERVLEILEESQALLTGHFLLTSGRHAGKYMQCAKILQYPHYAVELIGHIAEEFKSDNIDLVIAPAMGGIIVGYELARALGVQSLFTERVDGVMTLRRNFEIPQGARCLVAEDVVTTGGSVMEVVDIVRASGGILAGVGLLVDRSGGSVDFGAKTVAAYTAHVESWDAESCPLCAEGKLPIVKPGSKR